MGNSHPVLEGEASKQMHWKSVASTYRCYILFNIVIIHLEALKNHCRLITTIVTFCEVSSGSVIWDVHW